MRLRFRRCRETHALPPLNHAQVMPAAGSLAAEMEPEDIPFCLILHLVSGPQVVVYSWAHDRENLRRMVFNGDLEAVERGATAQREAFTDATPEGVA